MKPIVQYLVGAAAIVIIIAGLKLGAGPINQILLAFLLTMCITPLPEWLIRKGVPKAVSILVTIFVILVGGFTIMTLLASSVNNILESIPVYEERLTSLYNDFQIFAAANNLNISDLIQKANVSPDKIIALSGKLLTGLTGVISSSFIIAMLIVFMVIELISYYTDLRNGKRDEAFHLRWLTGMGSDLRCHPADLHERKPEHFPGNYFSIIAHLGLDPGHDRRHNRRAADDGGDEAV